ncbi:MAG: hypothetical protein ACFFAU_01290 [Candidatus Hodarchaeota archaeon]
MAETLKFSVGKITLNKGEANELVCNKATGITVSYSSAAVEFRGGDYDYPIDIKLGDLSCEVTVESAVFPNTLGGDADADVSDLLSDATMEIELAAGKQGGGLVGTIKNLKAVSYEIRSAQNAFVVSSLVLRKITELT